MPGMGLKGRVRLWNDGPNGWKIEEAFSPHKIVLHPDKEHKHSLIWLHGMDDQSEGYAGLFLDPGKNGIKLPEGCRVILPTATERKFTALDDKMVYSWFDMRFWGEPEDKNGFTDKWLGRKVN